MRYGSCQSPYPKMAGSSVGKCFICLIAACLSSICLYYMTHLRDYTFKNIWKVSTVTNRLFTCIKKMMKISLGRRYLCFEDTVPSIKFAFRKTVPVYT